MSTAASPRASDALPSPRWAVVVMGVSGCGKSTVAEGIAAALGLACIDGDHLHTADSVARMSAGIPLTDEDRWPWLSRIGARLCESPAAAGAPAGQDPAAATNGTVISCSALKRAYRDRLRDAAPGVRFIFLDGSAELIRARMLARRDHYMPPGLLDSQLRTLERPAPDETDVTAVSIDGQAADIVSAAVGALRGNS